MSVPWVPLEKDGVTVAQARELVNAIAEKHGHIDDETWQELDKISAKAREEIRQSYRSLANAAASSISTVAKNLYTSNARFVFELLQNAEDNHYTNARAQGHQPYVAFEVHEDRVIIECNEDGFNRDNLEAICNVGHSSKTGAQGYIGENGIGFKSIFMAAYEVHIQSGPYSFYFRHHSGDSGLGMITPVWEEPMEQLSQHMTRMTLLLHATGDPAALASQRQTMREQFNDLQEKKQARAYASAEVILAFSLSADSKAFIVKPQDVYGFLPMRYMGFSCVDLLHTSKGLYVHVFDFNLGPEEHFLIQSDFVTQVSTMLPRSERGLRKINELRILHPAQCDSKGEPLFNDLKPEIWLSNKHLASDIKILQNFGLRLPDSTVFLRMIEQDLRRPGSRMRCEETDEDWHTKTAKLLLRLIEVNTSDQNLELRNMGLIPERTGSSVTWISSNISDKIYLGETEGGFVIPRSLALRVVEIKSSRNPARVEFFKEMGVCVADPKMTYVPLLDLQQKCEQYLPEGEVFPFLKIDDHLTRETYDQMHWSFLDRLVGVNVTEDLDFYLAILSHLGGLAVQLGDCVFRLYNVIYAKYTESAAKPVAKTKIRNFFEEAPIYVPAYSGSSPSWASMNDCLWKGLHTMVTAKPLCARYTEAYANMPVELRNVETLFRVVLEIEDCGLNEIVIELVELNRYNEVYDKNVFYLYQDFSNLCKDVTGVEQRSTILDSTAADFVIVDTTPLESIFARRVKTLDFSLDEVHLLGPFIVWIGLGKKYMSVMVKEVTTVNGQTKEPTRRQERKISPKAHALYRYSPESLLSYYAVYETNEITCELTLSQDGEVHKHVKEHSDLHIRERGAQLEIFISRDRKSQHLVYLSKLGPRLFDWLLLDASMRIPDELALRGQFAIQKILNITERSLYELILEEDGIANADVEDMYESTESESGEDEYDDEFLNPLLDRTSIHATSGLRSSGSIGKLASAQSPGYEDLDLIPHEIPRQDHYRDLLCRVVSAARAARFNRGDSFDMSGMLSALPLSGDSRTSYGDYEFEYSSSLERDIKIGAAGELCVFELLKSLSLPNFSLAQWQSTIRHYVKVHPDTPFYMSQAQYRRMHTHRNQTEAVYVIFCVFEIQKQPVGIRVLMNPAELEAEGKLEFTAEKWSVKVTS
ncbi:hypothetical protein M406DRAFT_330736 [Cryphonectria parasitica EP155]|uniref:Protein NO VEIN C-terminal domain-containing protein n=1 Tax=Cryphonectria parasitica (strain ATCC 38755 / EP155) TaxID=660469 RepID=A0A9P5CNX3_CRYP1|nr:uncharacterized protein M406DRAFT_330736 [Cryphonectria parasitica EP155]KAF3764390.1 hypothetical protein M406DRAFT_330736 [Cryphonectria parasitica EP155]